MIDEQEYANEIARLAPSLPFLAQLVERLSAQVDVKAYTAIANGTLTPDGALAMWHSKESLHRLLKSVQSKVASLPILAPNAVDPNAHRTTGI